MSAVDERDFLLRSLRDLDAERAAGDIDEADYVRLRDDYTARAADALRSGGTERRRRSPTSARTAAVIAGLAVLAVVAGLLLARSAGERLPGQTVTGTIAEGSTDEISKAQQLAGQGKILEAIKLYDGVLKTDPQNPVALAQRGWLVSRAGLTDVGLASIDKAIAADPSYPDAHFFKAMILWRDQHKAAEAVVEFQAVLDHDPPPDLANTVNQLKAQAEAEASGSTQQP